MSLPKEWVVYEATEHVVKVEDEYLDELAELIFGLEAIYKETPTFENYMTLSAAKMDFISEMVRTGRE